MHRVGDEPCPSEAPPLSLGSTRTLPTLPPSLLWLPVPWTEPLPVFPVVSADLCSSRLPSLVGKEEGTPPVLPPLSPPSFSLPRPLSLSLWSGDPGANPIWTERWVMLRVPVPGRARLIVLRVSTAVRQGFPVVSASLPLGFRLHPGHGVPEAHTTVTHSRQGYPLLLPAAL